LAVAAFVALGSLVRAGHAERLPVVEQGQTRKLAPSAPRSGGQRVPLEAHKPVLLMHTLGRDFLQPGANTEVVDYGNQGPKGYSGLKLLFIRDYFPVQVVRQHGPTRELATLSYFNLHNMVRYDGTTSIPVPPPAKDVAFYQAAGKSAWLRSEVLPILFEGGNLAATDHFLITSEKVLHENALSLDEVQRHLAAADPAARSAFVRSLRQEGYRPRGRAELTELFAARFGVPKERVRFMPWMPGERTGHVDLYVAPLDANTVAVPTVPRALIDRLGMAHEREFAGRLNTWLDTRVRELEAQGITVERLPMLPPKNLVRSSLSEFGWDADYLSPVNWLIHEGKAVIPEYGRYLRELPGELAASMRREIEKVMGRYGYATEFRSADGLIGTNGGFHCVTANLGFTPPN
jgi:hypothetical protein